MKNILLLISILLLSAFIVNAQDKGITENIPKFRKAISAKIKGTSVYGQAELISGTQYEIRTEKHGIVYPSFFDWNKDGKKDLILGEFESATRYLDENSSCLKVYLNEGTKESPKYSGKYFYAKDINGSPLAAPAW